MALKLNKDKKQLTLSGDVGYPEGFDADEIEDALNELGGDEFNFVIRSDGGVITEGLSIYNQLRDYPGYIRGHVDVRAHSIASVIMLGADYLTASENATFLIHNAWTLAMGSAQELREIADALDLAELDILNAYTEASGKEQAFWKEKIDKPTTLNATEAKEMGLIHGVKETPKRKAEPQSLSQIEETLALVAKSRETQTELSQVLAATV